MAIYSFINNDFVDVDESTKEINIIRFDSGTVNLISKIIYQDQSEFDNVLGLIKKFDSEIKNFLNKNEHNPLYKNPVDYSKKYKKDKKKKKAVEIILVGLDLVNKLTDAVDKNLATIKFIDGNPNHFEMWSFRLTSVKKFFETL